ncbi:MAG: thiamine pyrophosphate-binding protein [Cyanobacteriota bacterium]|nr:thiamine pyrophosphate-binding protein [Cyanobacteriota bacterium]
MTQKKGNFSTTIVTESQKQLPPESISVAQQIVKLLEKMGVKLAFGVSGGAIAPIWAALEESSMIEVLHFRHEAGATFAAAEAYFASDRPVAAFATGGPGFINALTGLFAARWEGAKVIFLGASTTASHRGRWAFQETSSYTTPVAGLFTSGTLFDYAITVESASQLPDVAIRLAKGITQPGGFVAHINIPTDIQKSTSNLSLPKPENFSKPPVSVQTEIVKKYAKLLCEKRFAIWVGFGARGAAEEIHQLAEKTGAAVMCSPRGKGIFPEDHPQFVGVTGIGGHTSVFTYMREYLPQQVLVLGTRLAELTSFWNPVTIAPGGFIHVDIDPDVPGVAYPDAKTVSIHSDAKVFLQELLKYMKNLDRVEPSKPERLPRPQCKALESSTSELVRPIVLMEAIQKLIVEGSDAVVMSEPGNSLAWATNLLRFSAPNRYRTSTRFASMGHTVVGVVGTAAARQGKAVAIVGDGAMLMNCEISTAVKYQIPAVWIVLNDACYNMVEQVLPHFQCKELVQIPQTDFVQVARAMGADGICVEKESEINMALEKACAATGPFVVDVHIDPSQKAPTESRMMSLKNQVSHK